MSPEELKAKEARWEIVRQELGVLRKEFDTLSRDIAEEKSPYKIGDIVSWRHGLHRRRGVVKRVSERGMSVQAIKKSGAVGTMTSLYLWPSEEIRLEQKAGEIAP